MTIAIILFTITLIGLMYMARTRHNANKRDEIVYPFEEDTYRDYVGNVTQVTINGTMLSISHKTEVYILKQILNITPISGELLIEIKGDGANAGFIGVIQVTERNPE